MARTKLTKRIRLEDNDEKVTDETTPQKRGKKAKSLSSTKKRKTPKKKDQKKRDALLIQQQEQQQEDAVVAVVEQQQQKEEEADEINDATKDPVEEQEPRPPRIVIDDDDDEEQEQANRVWEKIENDKDRFDDNDDQNKKSHSSKTAMMTVNTTTTDKSVRSSLFLKKRIRTVVSLFPMALRDALLEIERSLQILLLRWNAIDGGALLAFDNVQIKGRGGDILNEQPQIHFTVDLDGLLFAPKEGMKIQGVVNECLPSHVGLLVLGYFNAAVPAQHLEASGFKYDRDLQQWERGSSIVRDQDTVEFTLFKIHQAAGTVSLEGADPCLIQVS